MTVSPKRSSRLAPLIQFALRASGLPGGRRIQGFVDAVVRGDTVVGWVRDTKDENRRLEVQLILGDEIVGFGVADLPRKDLLAAGKGDGRYGFRIRLNQTLFDGEARTLTVCAVTERGKTPLQRGQITISAGGATTAAGGAATADDGPARPMIGVIERLSSGALHGWAYNPDQPDAPAIVEFYDDEQYVGSVRADRSRPRLYEKGFPSGTRGFVYELPDDPGAGFVDRLRARVAGTMYDLKKSADLGTILPQSDKAPPVPVPTAPPSPPKPAAKAIEPEAEDIAPRIPARQAAPVARGAGAVGLLAVGRAGGGDAVFAGWAAQDHHDVRLLADDVPSGLPSRLSSVVMPASGNAASATLAREVVFILFARAGMRLDPEVACAIATLPGFPDVVVLGPEAMNGDAARMESFLRPDRPGTFAVRADLLAGYPGDVAREVAEGLLSPFRLWLAQRGDLRWQQVGMPGAGGGDAEDMPDAARADRWRAILDEQAWEIGGTGEVVVRPRLAPDRISLALWAGWDAPGLPALRALVETPQAAPFDILVPGEGDPAKAEGRLAGAEALIAEAPGSGSRARVVDCGTGHMAVCAALLAAADGDVTLLSDGAATLAQGDLARMAAWSLHPRIGGVGLMQGGGWSSGAMLGEGPALEAVTSGAGARIVSVTSFGLMMIATPRIAAIGMHDLAETTADFGAVEFSLRLARGNFHSMVLPGAVTGGAAPTPLPRGRLPWQVAARLRAGDLL